MKRLTLIALLLVALLGVSPAAAQTPDPVPLRLYAGVYCANGCELQVGDHFTVVLSVYTNATAPGVFVIVEPPSAPGVSLVSSSASSGLFDSGAWLGQVAYSQPITITHEYQVDELGPAGSNVVELLAAATINQTDESLPIEW